MISICFLYSYLTFTRIENHWKPGNYYKLDKSEKEKRQQTREITWNGDRNEGNIWQKAKGTEQIMNGKQANDSKERHESV